MTQTLTIKSKLDDIRQLYKEEIPRMRALILGEKGAGKTTLLETCPKPVLVHSFDPGGTESIRDSIESGEIIAITETEYEDQQNPQAYKLFAARFNEMKRNGIFNEIATYSIDSTTLFSDAIINQIVHRQGHTIPTLESETRVKKNEHGMQIQDWESNIQVWTNIVRSLTMLPCNTILFGHIDRSTDSMTNVTTKGLMLPGRSAEKVPIMFHELYILQAKETVKGVERRLLTQNDAEFRATTRMGRKGLFDRYEPADIRALLKKAGYPYEDKVSS